MPPLVTLLQRTPVMPVLVGYAAFGGATAALLHAIPRLGQLTALVAGGDARELLVHALPTLGLFIARAFLTMVSDTFIWHAAAAAAHSCRTLAFRGALCATESSMAALDGWDAGARNKATDPEVAPNGVSRVSPVNSEGLGGAAAVAARLGMDGSVRLGQGALAAEASLVSLLRALIPGAIQAACVVVLMVRTSAPLSLFALVAIPGMAAAVAGAGAGVRHLATRAAQRHAAVSARCAEVLGASELVRLYGAADHEVGALRARSAAWLSAETRHRMAASAVPMAITVTYAASVVALLAGGCHFVGAGTITGAQFASFVAAAALLVEPVQAASDAYNTLLAHAYDVRRFVGPLVAFANENDGAAAGAAAANTAERDHTGSLGDGALVTCNDVAYGYGATVGGAVLHGASFAVHPGEIVALVGESGRGKSTLLRVIAGTLTPQAGSVCIAPDTHVVLSPQDAPVLSGSVASNVAYPPPPHLDDASLAAQARAAAAACASDSALTHGLSAGVETQVGAGGSGLSGGQRQRVSLSRALHRASSLGGRAVVLLLDEPVSALDGPGAASVWRALGAWVAASPSARAVVAVTHGGVPEACTRVHAL